MGLDEVLTTPHGKKWPCYETDTHASGLDWSFGITSAMKKVNEIRYMKY